MLNQFVKNVLMQNKLLRRFQFRNHLMFSPARYKSAIVYSSRPQPSSNELEDAALMCKHASEGNI